MKRLTLIILALNIAAICNAQMECSKSSPFFKSDKEQTPTAVSKFGRNPQFTFLRNLSTAEQVASAIKKADKENKRGISHLNDLLTDIGFANGVKDVKAANITAQYIPNGTIGNMGDGNMGMTYSKLMSNDARGIKAWKIAANSSCQLFIIAACGNAFYETRPLMACIEVPVTVSGGPNKLVLEGGGIKTTTEKTYVYYQRKKFKSYEKSYAMPAIKDNNPSMPLLLSTKTKSEPVISKYEVTVTTPKTALEVCTDDKVVDIPTELNVEKQTEYAGYNADKLKTEYRKVSKRDYKKALRKITKAKKKERKVEFITGVPVNHGGI